MCAITILLEKIAARINDADIMRLIKQILKVSGKRGVLQVEQSLHYFLTSTERSG